MTCNTMRACRYILSVYWSITTLSTVGYGDWNPTTPAEMAFVVLYMLFVRAPSPRPDPVKLPTGLQQPAPHAVGSAMLGTLAKYFIRLVKNCITPTDACALRGRTSSSTRMFWAPSLSSSVRMHVSSMLISPVSHILGIAAPGCVLGVC